MIPADQAIVNTNAEGDANEESPAAVAPSAEEAPAEEAPSTEGEGAGDGGALPRPSLKDAIRRWENSKVRFSGALLGPSMMDADGWWLKRMKLYTRQPC